jgi:hypothetical protein
MLVLHSRRREGGTHMDYDDVGKAESWVKHLSFVKEYELSNCLDLVTAEDLVAATSGIGFDEGCGEWAFNVIASSGFPRKRLGVFVIRATGTIVE